MSTGHKNTAYLVCFAVGTLLGYADVYADVPDKVCSGTGSKCFASACNRPCDNYSCCEISQIPFDICVFESSKNCAEEMVDCATKTYYIAAQCKNDECTPKVGSVGTEKIQEKGCKKLQD